MKNIMIIVWIGISIISMVAIGVGFVTNNIGNLKVGIVGLIIGALTIAGLVDKED